MPYPFNTTKLNQLLNHLLQTDYIENDFLAQHQERLNRINRFKELLSAPKITEYELFEIIKLAWSTRVWNNKEWFAKHLIEQNGLEKLNKYFKILTDSKKSIAQRYKEFTKNIKGLGPAFTTEILCHVDPENAAIWNKKSTTVLRFIQAKDVNVTKYINANNFTAQDYAAFNAFMKILKDYIKDYLKLDKSFNLLDMDYVIWKLHELLPPDAKIRKNKNIVKTNDYENETEQLKTTKSKSYHNELRDKVAQIGQWLGFEADIERPISAGSRVDVVWEAKIANLGRIKYIFEVQHKGSIDSLLINLLKAKKDPTVQKLVIITDSGQIETIKKRIADMPESFRESIVFWQDTSVEEAHENLERLIEIIKGLGLVE